MPPSGRPPSPVTAEARRMRDAAKTWMKENRLNPAGLAVLAGGSASSIGRLFNSDLVAETPSLQKLHKYISEAQESGLEPALSTLDRIAKRVAPGDAAGAAEILRVVADLLERIERAR